MLVVEDDHSEALVYEMLLTQYESASFVVSQDCGRCSEVARTYRSDA